MRGIIFLRYLDGRVKLASVALGRPVSLCAVLEQVKVDAIKVVEAPHLLLVKDGEVCDLLALQRTTQEGGLVLPLEGNQDSHKVHITCALCPYICTVVLSKCVKI